MIKLLKYFILLLPILFVACEETESEDEEFANWQEVNANYFASLYNTTKQKIAGGDATWKMFKKWSLEESIATQPTDYIIVHILKEGTGTESPLFTDTASVHYAARLLPSKSFPSGYVFEKSYNGTFDEEISKPTSLAINSTNYPMSNGLATALQEMHIGDHWEVYIPTELAWAQQGATDSSTGATLVPEYSMIIVDITLVGYYNK